MNNYRLLDLAARLKTVKTQSSEDAVEILRNELTAALTQEERLGIYSMLGLELQSQGRFQEAETAIRERIALAPENPDPWITLALHFFYYAKDIEKALATINIAIQKSSEQRHFFRQAHLERIRIALALKAYSVIEESLISLIEYMPESGILDSRLETDFLVHIPQGRVNANLVERYKARAQEENQPE